MFTMRYRRGMIDSYIEDLQRSFRLQPCVPEGELWKLYRDKNYTGMAGYIKHTLKLPMGLRVGYVNSGGEGENVPAWVEMPDPLPPYGSQAFEKLQLTMYIRRSFLAQAPFPTVVAVMAYELCHIVLDSTGHPLRREEPAVDLTAMMLGYRTFYVDGCQYEALPPKVNPFKKPGDYIKRLLALWGFIETETYSTGYLSRLEVGYADALMGR